MMKFFSRKKKLPTIPELYYNDPHIQEWINVVRERGKPYTVQDFYDWEIDKKMNAILKSQVPM